MDDSKENDYYGTMHREEIRRCLQLDREKEYTSKSEGIFSESVRDSTDKVVTNSPAWIVINIAHWYLPFLNERNPWITHATIYQNNKAVWKPTPGNDPFTKKVLELAKREEQDGIANEFLGKTFMILHTVSYMALSPNYWHILI